MTADEKKSLREQLLQQWNDLGNKTRELGESLPAASFEAAPADGVRNAGEIFRHLAFWNQWVAATARGEKPDGDTNEIPEKSAPTKAKAITAFAESVDEAAKELSSGQGALDADTAALYASFLGHNSEHYGQLVVYARLAGVVPPTSR